jgi:hypothetical protein
MEKIHWKSLETSLEIVLETINTWSFSDLKNLTWIEAVIRHCYYEMFEFMIICWENGWWEIILEYWKNSYPEIAPILKQIAIKAMEDLWGEELTTNEIDKYIIETSWNVQEIIS